MSPIELWTAKKKGKKVMTTKDLFFSLKKKKTRCDHLESKYFKKEEKKYVITQ